VVAYLYSKHLDRSKPLWELWVIEGLAGNKFAILQKLHHCMMDGEGASKLGELLCDLEPDAMPRPVDPAIRDAKAGAVPDWLSMSATTAYHLARFPGSMYRRAIDIVSPRLLQSLGLRRGRRKPAPPAPMTIFNGKIGGDRGFILGSLSLADLKKVRRAFDVTVNDVLLALVSTSLRNYLENLGELPEPSLRTSLPVSLRTEADDDFSNRVTQVSVTLASNLEDPVARLQTISADCEEAKQLVHEGGKGFIELIQSMPPWMVTAVMGITAPEQAAQMLGCNLIVSNVHGSDDPLYIAGARLETMYPMSIITQGMGLNFTCVSYAGNVNVGVTTAPDLVPDPWDIVEGLGAALREYVKLTRKAAGRRKSVEKTGAATPPGRRSGRAKSALQASGGARRRTTSAGKPARGVGQPER